MVAVVLIGHHLYEMEHCSRGEGGREKGPGGAPQLLKHMPCMNGSAKLKMRTVEAFRAKLSVKARGGSSYVPLGRSNSAPNTCTRGKSPN